MTQKFAENTSERQNIRDVIHAETQAFQQADFQSWSDCWSHNARAGEFYSSQDFGLIVLRGWKEIGGHMRHVLQTGMGCTMVEFRQADLQISIHGAMAWVVFDSSSTNKNGATEESFETRILEFENGQWKIIFASFAARHSNTLRVGRLALDAKGNVTWASPATLDSLLSHRGLTISAGRLRATRPAWDKVLQKAIERAGEFGGFFAHHRFAEETGSTFRCPVILGEDDNGLTIICNLSVCDGVTYLDTDSDKLLDQRLAAASVIFGLSKGQIAVAAKIARGQKLKAAASELGISVNTARTHLSRIFEKTGVNAQTALIRLLLSVG